ncbi:MAG: ABC transporter permease subunit [Candidatus Eisenbacteria bacterium]
MSPTVMTLTRKEFSSYFQSTIAYIFITLFLVLSNWLFFWFGGFFTTAQATLRDFFFFVPWLFLFFVPAATMRLWAEEKKLGTVELLLTFPVKDWEVVVGKFLASFLFLAVTLGLTLPLAITVIGLGNPDNGALICGYLGCLMIGGAFLAIGLWASSTTANQIVAFIVTVVICFVLYVIGTPPVLSSVPQPLVPFFANLSLSAHFESIGRGVVDTRDVIYYLSIITFFLFMNVRQIESRKWS